MRPPVLKLVVQAVVTETIVFRIVRGGSPQNPEVIVGLNSNYGRGFDPRGAEVSIGTDPHGALDLPGPGQGSGHPVDR